MPNNLKKVSGLDPIDPSQMVAGDMFYYVHEENDTVGSYSLSLSDLFLGTNYLTSDMAFNNDTLYIKSGKVGINGSPSSSQTFQVTGSVFISSYANVNSYLITGGNITSKSSIISNNDITAHGNLVVDGGAVIPTVTSNTAFSATVSVNVLKSTNISTPQTSYTELINIIYPVGSIYTSTISTNPNALFGLGTWVAYGEGRVLVGKATSGTFGTPGAIGGAETVTLTSAQSGLPAHSHPASDSGHTHPYSMSISTAGDSSGNGYNQEEGKTTSYTGSGYANITVSNNTAQNASEAHTNLQPYVVVYMWRRTA